MGDVTENFFLVEIETQRNLRMLQVIIATAGIGFIRARLQNGEKKDDQACDAEHRLAGSAAISVTSRYSDHSCSLP